MKSTFKLALRLICLGFMGIILLPGCKKEDTLTIPPAVAHFTNLTGSTYFITGPGVTFKIPVGVSTVSDVARTISFTVTSPTGAVSGTQYTLDKTVITIPAGNTLDSIEVRGIYDEYISGRKDTLVFTLSEPSVKAAPYNSTYTLYMRGPCFDGDVTLADFMGDYKNTNETFSTSAYGPYTTAVTSVTSTGPTTGEIVVTNIFDDGWGPITFTLDWTDPANRTVTVVDQDAVSGSNAGGISSTYEGQTVAVTGFPGESGTFSVCKQTIQLKMALGVTGLGFFSPLYTVNLAR